MHLAVQPATQKEGRVNRTPPGVRERGNNCLSGGPSVEVLNPALRVGSPPATSPINLIPAN